MDKNLKLYQDIATRTQGDIYIGVVGPVRTGKSTFIKRFMDLLVIPNIENEYKRQRAQDGAFNLFPNRVKPVKVIGIKEELYREILIPGTIKGIVKKELEEICNIHQGVLFPESLSYTSLKLKKEAEERIRSNMCL